MSFNRTLAKKVQEESEKALAEIAKKYGVTIKGAGGSLGSNDFTMKMKVELVGVKKTYDPYVYTALGLPENVIGKTFVSRGEKYEITEISTRSPKYPVIARNSKGKGFKFTVDSVNRLIK